MKAIDQAEFGKLTGKYGQAHMPHLRKHVENKYIVPNGGRVHNRAHFEKLNLK